MSGVRYPVLVFALQCLSWPVVLLSYNRIQFLLSLFVFRLTGHSP